MGSPKVIWYNDWIKSNIKEGSLKDKVVIITGANSGIGYWCCNALAGIGHAIVIMACRNNQKACKAKEDILKIYPNAIIDCSLPLLDNSNLNSVRTYCGHSNATQK